VYVKVNTGRFGLKADAVLAINQPFVKIIIALAFIFSAV
jgi:hypothetical protein